LKRLSWVLTFILGVLLCYACTLLPPAGDAASPLSVHVSSRYLESGSNETGFSCLEAAILADYRSFDLFLLGSFFFASALAVSLLLMSAIGGKQPPSAGWALTGSALGALILAIVGFYCLKGGSNFLDYEPFAALVKPGWARLTGAILLAMGCTIALSCNLWMVWRSITRDKEADLGN